MVTEGSYLETGFCCKSGLALLLPNPVKPYVVALYVPLLDFFVFVQSVGPPLCASPNGISSRNTNMRDSPDSRGKERGKRGSKVKESCWKTSFSTYQGDV